MKRFFTCLALFAAVATSAAVAPSSAQASELEIQFLGLDFKYDGTNVFDAQSAAGGNGNPVNADALTSVKFLVDGSVVGTLNSDIWSDIFIENVLNIPAAGGAVTSGGNGDDFGFDLLTNNLGFGLAQNINQATIFYSGNQIFVSGGGLVSSVPVQNLPFGLVLDVNKPITFAFSSANLSNVTTSGGFVTGFSASGTGNIRATLVPEPSSAILLLLGGLGSIAGLRRRG